MKPYRTIVLACSLAFGAATAHASGIPVYDGGNFTQNVVTSLNSIVQVATQANQYYNQLQQYKNQLEQAENIGAGGFGAQSAFLDDESARVKGFVASNNDMQAQLVKQTSLLEQYKNIAGAATDTYNIGKVIASDIERAKSGDEAARVRINAMQSVINQIERINHRRKELANQIEGTEGLNKSIQTSNGLMDSLVGQNQTIMSIMAQRETQQSQKELEEATLKQAALAQQQKALEAEQAAAKALSADVTRVTPIKY